jgi:hypothetical protein
MTRARRITPGLGNPPLIQLWLEAVLCAFVRLVQGVATTFGMRRRNGPRDWHTSSKASALPRTKPDIQQQELISGSGQHVRLPGAGRDPASAHSALFTGTRLSPLIPTSFDKLWMSVGIQRGRRGVFGPAASSPHTRKRGSIFPALILSLSKDARTSGSRCNTPA